MPGFYFRVIDEGEVGVGDEILTTAWKGFRLLRVAEVHQENSEVTSIARGTPLLPAALVNT
jgi:MOSC domain-containing protein YiiM